ncbi:MAG TPA: hypothetical protein VKB79_12770 [Bryobacteraceae bacterium]|nr:hypothetical protein [Bryobacteraceae bacterium]
MRAANYLLAVITAVAAAALLSTTGQASTQRPSVELIRVPNSGIQPQIVERGGVVHLLYFTGDPAKGDLNYVMSRDYGKTFSTPIRVNNEPGTAMATGNIRGGQMAIGANGIVHVAWIGSAAALPRAASNSGPVLYARLNDARDRFEKSQHLNQASWGADGASIAADSQNDVFVFWHAQPPNGKDESNRRVWLAKSTDAGRSFAGEKVAFDEPTGVCVCCGSKAFVDVDDTVYLLFRAATEVVHRDMYLLSSVDRGQRFHGSDVAAWNIGACVMSSAALVHAGQDVLAGWESEKQVFFGKVDRRTHKVGSSNAAPGTGKNRKYPALAVNRYGETLFAWTDNMSWAKGGTVEWQLYDPTLQTQGISRQADGVPAWSLVAAFARPDGNFTVVF